jgi:hypothetical protein
MGGAKYTGRETRAPPMLKTIRGARLRVHCTREDLKEEKERRRNWNAKDWALSAAQSPRDMTIYRYDHKSNRHIKLYTHHFAWAPGHITEPRVHVSLFKKLLNIFKCYDK